ncbi:MAG: hypothetical protein QXY16_00490 [Nanopusillaceae archaeon]
MIGSMIKITRSGKKVYTCPLCGHVFMNNKKYTKHLNKSHLRKLNKDNRKRKKMNKKLLIIKIKEENGIEITNREKILKMIAKFNNIKL